MRIDDVMLRCRRRNFGRGEIWVHAMPATAADHIDGACWPLAVVEHGKRIHVHDLRQSLRPSFQTVETYASWSRTVLATPLCSEGISIGAIAFAV